MGATEALEPRWPTGPVEPVSGPGGAPAGRAGRVLGPVVSARTWLALVYLVSGVPISIVSFFLAVFLTVFGVVFLPLALAGLPILVGDLLAARFLAALERGRVALMLDRVVGVPVRREPAGPGRWQRAKAVLTDPVSWRELSGSVLALPMTVIGLSVAISTWSIALALIALPAYNFALPRGGASAFGWVIKGVPSLTGAVLVGLVLLLLAPYVTRGVTMGQAWVVAKLLGPSRGQALAVRVGTLEQSRSRMVVAADSERRRIERDLHDGAQARLVSVAMELGRARARFEDDPEGAKALVDQAHEEAKAALVELRNLVRGVHPPVLSDRGLDAALSGLAAICPVPVTVTVDMAERPPSSIEAVAYFVVAESLTNIAKHSGATHAAVNVRSGGGRLSVTVVDDGRGGAQPNGAGLTGLADRVQAVDGQLGIDSPPGGPTVIHTELPCGS